MKICIVTTGSTMMSLFVTGPAQYMHERGVEITLICNMDESFIEQNSFAKCIPIKAKRGLDFFGMIRATLRLRKLFKAEKYDMIQYSSPNASLCASVAGKLAGIKTRLYCQWGIRYVSLSGLKRAVFKYLEKLTCQCSTFVEPDSLGNLKFGIAEGLYPAEKSRVVWNGSACGINLKKFDISKKESWREEIRKELNLSQSDFVYGFVGRITKDKGVEELITAFEDIDKKQDSCKLLLIGEQNELHTLRSDLVVWANNNPNVIFTGRINCVEKYFASIDAFVLPSYREGFGSVVIEAAAMGVPIIVSNIPGPTDIIENNKNGLVIDKKDVHQLLVAMEALKNSQSLCKRLSDNGANVIKEKYDQAIMLEKLYEDRKQLIKDLKINSNG